MFEEVLLHEVVIALRVAGSHPNVLVQVECRDLSEVEPFVAMHADQFLVESQRR